MALLARSALAFALGPLEQANVEACYTPAVADRGAEPLETAYAAIIEAMDA